MVTSPPAHNLLGPLAPIRSFLLARKDVEELSDSTVACPNPARAPHFYALEIWPGLDPSLVRRYESATGIPIPEPYQEILTQLNGATLGDVSLYGIPPSMLETPPLLNRRRRQPLDLEAANRHWRFEYSGCSRLFHFGGVVWSPSEIAGLFLTHDGEFEAYLRSGERVRTFDSLTALISFGLTSLEA
jgi:hypothetical protein